MQLDGFSFMCCLIYLEGCSYYRHCDQSVMLLLKTYCVSSWFLSLCELWLMVWCVIKHYSTYILLLDHVATWLDV